MERDVEVAKVKQQVLLIFRIAKVHSSLERRVITIIIYLEHACLIDRQSQLWI